MKTSELTGDALNWAVAKAMGHENGFPQNLLGVCVKGHGHERVSWSPSTNWSQAGMLIERERIELKPVYAGWAAFLGRQCAIHRSPLVAAMRCYVMHKLGPEVGVPEELQS